MADPGDRAYLLPRTLVGSLFPGWQEDRREEAVSFLLLGCPFINITLLINIKAFSAAHFEELPTFIFPLVIEKSAFIMSSGAVFFTELHINPSSFGLSFTYPSN